MANTYSKIYLHVIFAVKNRNALLREEWRPEVFKYLASSINNRGNCSYAVNGSFDHVHLFFDYKGRELLKDLVREIKKSSNEFIKRSKFTKTKFEWQSGYGAFSHGYREKDTVIKYITNQKEHHAKKKFSVEYLQMLKSFEIEFKNEYVFKFLD